MLKAELERARAFDSSSFSVTVSLLLIISRMLGLEQVLARLVLVCLATLPSAGLEGLSLGREALVNLVDQGRVLEMVKPYLNGP